MYNAFFEFEKNPFASRPDLAFFYRSHQHDSSLRSLSFAVQARMGLASLIGEQGTGKTAVLENLRDSLETTQVPCAFLREPRLSTNRFFQTIASELDLRCQGTSAYQVFSALHQFTLQQAKKGRTVALIVDDAHNLPADVLNEILHLASLHDDKVKLLQTVLAGRPELHNTLDALNLERLKQHAILGCTLEPFTAQETQYYIEFRLAQAGMPEQTVFPREALAEIYERSRGFAPAINAICEGLLLAAFTAQSKACTQEILDQVFRKPRTEQPETIEVAPTVVAVTRIDLSRLVAGADPEPADVHTTLLRLIFTAAPGFTASFPLKGNGLHEPQPATLRMVFPTRKFVLPVKGFAMGSKKRMLLGFDAGISSPPPLAAIPSEMAIPLSVALHALHPARKPTRPVVKLRAGSKKPMQLGKSAKGAVSADPRVQAAALAGSVLMPAVGRHVLSAQPRFETRLQRLCLNNAARISSPPTATASATTIDFPGVALQPAHSVVESLKAGMANLAPKGVDRLVRLSYSTQLTGRPGTGTFIHAEPQAISLEQTVGTPTHPALLAGDVLQTGAPRIRESALISLEFGLQPEPALASALAGALTGSIPCASALQAMHPAAKLQPAGTVRLPRVPVTAFKLAKSDPPSVKSTEVHFESAHLASPVAPAFVANRTASHEPEVREQSHPLPMLCNISPAVPPAERPIKTFLKALPSLQPTSPFSKLEPVDPRQSFLLLSTPKAFETSIEQDKPVFSHRKWILRGAMPMLVALALYSATPVMRSAAGAVNQGWQSAHQTVTERATISLNEDFRAGLDNWTNRAGTRPSWTSDSAGFVHPGALALYRPSMALADYQMQFVGTIDKKVLSWVVRAADFNNYYAVRLAVLKPGPMPAIGVTRYAVIDGRTQNAVTTPLLMSARSDTVYQVNLDVSGERFALSIQGKPVASWSEPKLSHGGIGFFNDPDAGSRIASVHVTDQDDPLGRLCAFLAPPSINRF